MTWRWYAIIYESGGLFLPSLRTIGCHDSHLSQLVIIDDTLQGCDHWSWNTWCQWYIHVVHCCTVTKLNESKNHLACCEGFYLNYFFVLARYLDTCHFQIPPIHLLRRKPCAVSCQDLNTVSYQYPQMYSVRLDVFRFMEIIDDQGSFSTAKYGEQLSLAWTFRSHAVVSDNQDISKWNGGFLCS